MTSFAETGSIQYDTIGNSGTYAIAATGAQGGGGGHGGPGGMGAAVSGDIYLTSGTELEIVVGGAGDNDGGYGGGGGGGGSFVFEVDSSTLAIESVLAVGGGGGGGGGSGGAGGDNGSTTSGSQTGGGGGGEHSLGGGNSGGTGAVAGGIPGTGFTGGTGGSNTGGTGGVDGGFGGGGGGGAGGGFGGGAGGGGGGYGGGSGGSAGFNGGGGGGGGGSYLDSGLTDQMDNVGALTGNGLVTIDEVPCFLEGTRIATPGGERAVESLGMGDLVATADGRTAPVRWIGRRTLLAEGEAGYRFADPLVYRPIRIRAGALAETLPARDLLVSTDHAVLIDGLLVQAGALVNGVSVVREADLPERFTYYHIELADHALVLAEGVPAETFVDNVTRMGFDNWSEHEALYGTEPSVAELPYPRVQSHRQLPLAIQQRMTDRTLMETAA